MPAYRIYKIMNMWLNFGNKVHRNGWNLQWVNSITRGNKFEKLVILKYITKDPQYRAVLVEVLNKWKKSINFKYSTFYSSFGAFNMLWSHEYSESNKEK